MNHGSGMTLGTPVRLLPHTPSASDLTAAVLQAQAAGNDLSQPTGASWGPSISITGS